MNHDSDSRGGLHIPFAILALAIAVLLASQIGAANKSAEIMRWQRETLEKQIASMQALEKQGTETYEKRGALVQQSVQLKKQLETLINDLLDLAKDDADAKQIVEKWKIQRAAPPAEAEEKKTP